MCICICIHTYIHTHIYIYIYREREKERGQFVFTRCSLSRIRRVPDLRGGALVERELHGVLTVCISYVCMICIYIYTHTYIHIYIYIYTHMIPICIYIYIYMDCGNEYLACHGCRQHLACSCRLGASATSVNLTVHPAAVRCDMVLRQKAFRARRVRKTGIGGEARHGVTPGFPREMCTRKRHRR